MKLILKAVVILCAGLAAPNQLIHAQEVSAYLGFGGVYDKSSGAAIDTFSDGTLYKTPTLNGAFGQVGISVLFGKEWGIGAEITRRLVQGDYAGLALLTQQKLDLDRALRQLHSMKLPER